MKKIVIVTMALCVMLLSGCGTDRKVFRVNPPVVNTPGDGRPVVIGDVTDARDFLVTPEGSGARLMKSTLKDIAGKEQARVIGGVSRFVWELPEHVSVKGWTRDLVATSLQKNGFRVIPAEKASSDVPVVNIRIDEFWSYVPANFGRVLTWTQQMKAWVHTTLSITKDGRVSTADVHGLGAHIVHWPSEENVRQAYDLAVDDYIKQFQQAVPEML